MAETKDSSTALQGAVEDAKTKATEVVTKDIKPIVEDLIKDVLTKMANKEDIEANSVKEYGSKLLKWLMFALVVVAMTFGVSYVASRFGITIVLPPTPMPVEKETVLDDVMGFCGNTGQIGEENFVAKPWPVKRITWCLDTSAYRGNLSKAQLIEAFTIAWASFAAHIDIDPVFITDHSRALVVSKFGDIDGSGKVLAWSHLADGTTTPKHQLYDAGENWENAANPTQVDLVRVAAHEIGHVLGLVHDTDDSKALLAPFYSRTIRFPTGRDIKRLLILGYKEKKVSDVPSIPPGTITINIGNITFDRAPVIKALQEAGYTVKLEPK